MNKFILKPDITPDESQLESLLEKWSDEEDDRHIRDLWKYAVEIASPKALVRESDVKTDGEKIEINGVIIKSKMMAENFSGLEKVYPYAASCGRELYEWYLSLDDVIDQYIADEISKIYLYQIITHLNSFVNENLVTDGRLASMNPGSLPDVWALTGQRELFKILETAESDTGITLTESCLMLPSKASSGIFFSSAKEYENCKYCPRIDCPGRRAEYIGLSM